MNELIDGAVDREKALAREAIRSLGAGAQVSVVNRTHRVVRQRAAQMSARRNQMRSLWLPVIVCASMLMIVVTAVWTMLDQYELNPIGMPDASDQYVVLLFWFLPVTAALLAIVWLRRTQNRRSKGEIAR
jgi:sterol desaturase/sphingolipid hydroxylase (fatty acid hydroxylase superfamily)